MKALVNTQKYQSVDEENIALRNENAMLKEELAHMQERLDWLNKQLFGRKSEKTSVIMEEGSQLSMFEEDTNAPDPVPEETITVPEHKRKKKRTHEDWMKSLPVKIEHYDEEHPVCEKCGSEMEKIGEEQAYEELVYVPAEYFIRRHMVSTYKCKNCGSDPENSTEPCNIRRAECPSPMIPKSFCSPELLAHIAYEKMAKGIPLYRQEKDMSSKGIQLLRATMSNWMDVAAKDWCIPIVQAMAEKLKAGSIAHSDDTTIQVLHEEGRKPTSVSRMWVYTNSKKEDHSIVIFDYQPTRAGRHPSEFLKGFSGYLICDGYDGYNAVTGIKRCGCLAHTRRKFVDALPKDKEAYKTSVAAKAVSYCNRIYHEEGILAEMSAEERYEQRLVKVKPLLDAFFAWLDTLSFGGKSKLAEAIRYALNERKYLYTFLENGDVPIDNNRAENAIRPFAVGRKNWLFSNTSNGAKGSAALYSIISTAQANGLDAEKYLTDLLRHPAGTILFPWDQ